MSNSGAQTALEARINSLERQLASLKQSAPADNSCNSVPAQPLTSEEYVRYGRQMIMPEWGLPGQLKLKQAKIAVIGVGGLGCPALQYLVGAGVGTIGIFDHDTVSSSNLHRQILHRSDRVGWQKVDSAQAALHEINPFVTIIPHAEALQPGTALEQLKTYSVILDCTDRPNTRYLIGDVSVLLGVPLVHGAALGSIGQWSIYNHQGGPCYRCIWPQVLPGGSGTCDERGVWGPVTGVVGNMMAAETIKLLLGHDVSPPTLHMFQLNSQPHIRSIKLRRRSPKCFACGEVPGLTRDLETVGYDAFCSGPAPTFIDDELRIDVKDLGVRLREGGLTLVDTRSPTEFEICAIPKSINRPLATLLADPKSVNIAEEVVVICRRGNDSQTAVAALRNAGIAARDVRGGLVAWTREIDPSFPMY